MRKILLVEDNAVCRTLMSRRLQLQGYEVLEAGNGREAVSTARAARPDLILMDLGLPEMDGWEATKLLKAQAATSGIPIIVLTARSSENDIERAIRAGCDHYETKPVMPDRLVSKIEELIAASAKR